MSNRFKPANRLMKPLLASEDCGRCTTVSCKESSHLFLIKQIFSHLYLCACVCVCLRARTCLCEHTENHGHNSKRLNSPRWKNSHICIVRGEKLHWKWMESIFHLVEHLVYYTQTKYYWKLIFVRYQTQIWSTACLDLWLWCSWFCKVKHVLEMYIP